MLITETLWDRLIIRCRVGVLSPTLRLAVLHGFRHFVQTPAIEHSDLHALCQ